MKSININKYKKANDAITKRLRKDYEKQNRNAALHDILMLIVLCVGVVEMYYIFPIMVEVLVIP